MVLERHARDEEHVAQRDARGAADDTGPDGSVLVGGLGEPVDPQRSAGARGALQMGLVRQDQRVVQDQIALRVAAHAEHRLDRNRRAAAQPGQNADFLQDQGDRRPERLVVLHVFPGARRVDRLAALVRC
jgi:hypothetical protein